MRHHPPDSSTHPRQASVPPAAEPAWGWGSCRKLVPADSALPASPPHPSSTPGTAGSSGGLPRGPAVPEPCCPRQGRCGLLGAQGSPTSAQLLPGPCELREGPALAHSLIPSSPPAQPASGITCNWNLGSPASSGTQGTWPQAKSRHPGGEGARSRQGPGPGPAASQNSGEDQGGGRQPTGAPRPGLLQERVLLWRGAVASGSFQTLQAEPSMSGNALERGA